MSRSGNLGVIVTASLAGLLFGFDTVVISGVTDSLRSVFDIAPGSFWAGFSVAIGLVGTFLGAWFAGKPGDRFGSRNSSARIRGASSLAWPRCRRCSSSR